MEEVPAEGCSYEAKSFYDRNSLEHGFFGVYAAPLAVYFAVHLCRSCPTNCCDEKAPVPDDKLSFS